MRFMGGWHAPLAFGICLNDECPDPFKPAGHWFFQDFDDLWFCSIECLRQDKELNERN